MAASKADQPRINGRFAKKPRTGFWVTLMPVLVYAAVIIAASILWGIGTQTGPAGPALIAAAAGGATALIVDVCARRRSWTRKGRGTTLIATVAATLWTIAWICANPSWLLTTIGFGLTLLAGIPWWRARHIPNVLPVLAQPDPEPAVLEMVAAAAREIDDPVAVVVDRWNTRFANQGTLAGSTIECFQSDGKVHKFIVHLVDGRQTYDMLYAAKGLIASAMNVSDVNILVERDRENAAKATLTVATGVDFGEVKRFERPMFDPKTGRVIIGYYTDDNSPAILNVIVPNGMYGTFFCGAQGTGKSQCMEQTILSLLASGLFSLLYIDPQGGMSSPMLAEAATWSAKSVEEGVKLIKQLPRMRAYRQAKFARRGWSGYRLSPEFPAVIIAIDEFQEITEEAEALAVLTKLAKTFRKVGAAFFAATQDIGLDAFGGEQGLRSQLMAMNVVYFATPSRVQGHLSGNNEFDPSTLPFVPGFGFLKEVRDERGNLLTRAAPFRALFFGHDNEYGMNPGVHWLRKLRKECRFANLDDGSAGALGEAFAGREADSELQEANAAALIDACEKAGQGLISADELEALFNPAAPKPDETGTQSRVPTYNMGLSGTHESETDPAEQIDGKKTQAILNAIRLGAWTTAEIIRRVAETGETVSTSLVEQQLASGREGNLAGLGLVVRIGKGHHHAPGYEANCGKCRGGTTGAAPSKSRGRSSDASGSGDTFNETYDSVMETTNAY